MQVGVLYVHLNEIIFQSSEFQGINIGWFVFNYNTRLNALRHTGFLMQMKIVNIVAHLFSLIFLMAYTLCKQIGATHIVPHKFYFTMSHSEFSKKKI